MTGRSYTADDSFHTDSVHSLLYSYSTKVVLFTLLEQLCTGSIVAPHATHSADVAIQALNGHFNCKELVSKYQRLGTQKVITPSTFEIPLEIQMRRGQ